MHNHSDNNILEDGNAESMIRMGVTSMILGEGSSAAPTSRFPRFRDYWAAILKGGVATNIGSYVGSGLIYQTRTALSQARQPPPKCRGCVN